MTSIVLTRTDTQRCFGFSVSREDPGLVTWVYMSTPADGKLVQGNRITFINGTPVDEIIDIPAMIGQNMTDRVKECEWGRCRVKIPQKLELVVR